MGKANITIDNPNAIQTLDKDGNVQTVVLSTNTEGARIKAKREGSRSGKLERRQKTAQPVAKREPMALQATPITWDHVKTVTDLMRGAENLGIALHGVYKQITSDGVLVYFFILSKKVPKVYGDEEKLVYNKGEFKTVYMYARVTEFGEFDVTGTQRHYTRAEIDRMVYGWSIVSGAEIGIIDMKAEIARMNGKEVAPVAKQLTVK